MRHADGEPAVHYVAVIVGPGFQERDSARSDPSGYKAFRGAALIVTKKDSARSQAALSGSTLTASGFWTGRDAGVTSPVGGSRPVPKQPLFMA